MVECILYQKNIFTLKLAFSVPFILYLLFLCVVCKVVLLPESECTYVIVHALGARAGHKYLPLSCSRHRCPESH